MNTEQLLLGTTANLYVLRFSRFGVYLGSGTDRDFEVLLPNNQVSDSLEKGDKIDVFLYKDSEDRLIATTQRPYLSLGETAVLEVKDVTGIGAFLEEGGSGRFEGKRHYQYWCFSGLGPCERSVPAFQRADSPCTDG